MVGSPTPGTPTPRARAQTPRARTDAGAGGSGRTALDLAPPLPVAGGRLPASPARAGTGDGTALELPAVPVEPVMHLGDPPQQRPARQSRARAPIPAWQGHLKWLTGCVPRSSARILSTFGSVLTLYFLAGLVSAGGIFSSAGRLMEGQRGCTKS